MFPPRRSPWCVRIALTAVLLNRCSESPPSLSHRSPRPRLTGCPPPTHGLAAAAHLRGCGFKTQSLTHHHVRIESPPRQVTFAGSGLCCGLPVSCVVPNWLHRSRRLHCASTRHHALTRPAIATTAPSRCCTEAALASRCSIMANRFCLYEKPLQAGSPSIAGHLRVKSPRLRLF